jgi:hypothetical protein
LMISVPPGIQSQLGEAISVIADSDFWERWQTLVDVSCSVQCGDALLTLLCLGSCFQAVAEQPYRQHWCAPSRAFHFQEMETFVPVRCALYRDQPRSWQIWHSVPGPV